MQLGQTVLLCISVTIGNPKNPTASKTVRWLRKKTKYQTEEHTLLNTRPLYFKNLHVC